MAQRKVTDILHKLATMYADDIPSPKKKSVNPTKSPKSPTGSAKKATKPKTESEKPKKKKHRKPKMLDKKVQVNIGASQSFNPFAKEKIEINIPSTYTMPSPSKPATPKPAAVDPVINARKKKKPLKHRNNVATAKLAKFTGLTPK